MHLRLYDLIPVLRWSYYVRTCTLIGLGGSVASFVQAQSLQFERNTRDIGVISEDDSAQTYRFSYQNVADHPVQIVRYQTTCGCTYPRFKKTPIAPKEKGVIEITFTPLGRAGDLHRTLYFYTDSKIDQPDFTLTLTGKVLPSSDPYIDYPYAIGPLRLMQSTVHFPTISGKRKQMVCIEVVNAGHRTLQLSTAGLPAYIQFQSNPTKIAPDEKADLWFIINPQTCPQRGKIEQDFLLEGVGDVSRLQRTMQIVGEIK